MATSKPTDAFLTGSMNTCMVQNVLLLWVDKNIDENRADCRNTLSQLRRAVNTINKYTNGEECIEFLKTIQNDKACMLISGSLGQHVVPQVHDMSQVESIFIFCNNRKYHELWVKDWPKIKGTFTKIEPICEALKKSAHQCEQDAMPMSFMTVVGDVSKKNLDQLDPSFMYTQILKEILLSIKFKQEHTKEFTEYCCDIFVDNADQLENVKKFEQEYHDKMAIWWYTYECFLYPMLNRALRLMETDKIVKMGFFIGDLHRQIKQLHRQQFGGHSSKKIFRVYRGQGMSRVDFEQMSKTQGGLMSFNNFLSTSTDRKVALTFSNDVTTNSETVYILFEMTIDPIQSTAPFASITNVSYYDEKEGEVLFSMHTVFRIGEITSMSENSRSFQVKLTLTSDNDKDLCALTDQIRKETYPTDQGWFRLGAVLQRMGQSQRAEQLYALLLEQTTDEGQKGRIYHMLALIKDELGNYEEAIKIYDETLAIYEKTLAPTHLRLANCYNDIGLVYNKMGNHAKALSSHEKALAIKKQSLPENHPDLGSSYNNIGAVHYNMGDYPKALLYYKKDLGIRQQSLPSNHPNFGMSYNNIGLVNENMKNYSKAYSFYERAVDIGQQSLPSDHSDLKMYRRNLERVKNRL